MAKSVNESGAKYLILKDFLPSGEREVCGDDGGFFPSSERQVVEKHLSAFLVKADITEFITDDEIVPFKTHVHGALQQVKAPEVARKAQHALKIPAQSLPLVACGQTAALRIYIVAYATQPHLGVLNGVKVHASGERASPNIVYAALHMPLLPAGAGVAEILLIAQHQNLYL